ncbi:hypothetical protein AB6O49_26825 [Streptomyces sp. SBR177]
MRRLPDPAAAPLVQQAGFVIEYQKRLKAGVVERVVARKPAA